MDEQSGMWETTPNSALKELDLLIGEWTMVGSHPAFAGKVKGHSSFKWLENGALLVWHFDWERPGPPSAVSVIGHDDSGGEYCVLYSDERGVARIYQMSLEGRLWKMHRESPGFSQRMTATFSEDGNTITNYGELSQDGLNWAPDLDVIYTKV
jgi:hypothetical protein